MHTSRSEAFSDGVFAIAATLLVLNVHVPSGAPHLAHALVELWPSIVAYLISFLLIGLIWANHHSMFVHFARVDRPLQFLNVLLLADVAFVPFPTDVLAQAIHSGNDLSAAAFFYGLTLTIGGVFFNALWLYGTKHRELLHPKTSRQFLQTTGRRFLAGPLSYAVMTCVALAAPAIAIVGYVALIVFYWLPPKDEAALFAKV